MHKLTALLLALIFISCSSSNEIAIHDNKDYNSELPIKKIVTLSVYDLNKERASDDDPVLVPFAAIVSKNVNDIYESSIPGGVIVSKTADKIGIKNDVNSALKIITETAMQTRDIQNEGGGGIGLNVLSKLSSKLGVDGLIIPLSLGNYENLKNGEKLSIGFLVFDARNSTWKTLGETSVQFPKTVTLALGRDDSKFEELAKTQIANAANELMKNYRKSTLK